MQTVLSTMLLRASPEEAWCHITDFETLARLTPTVDEYSICNIGETGFGTRFYEVHNILGRRVYTGRFVRWCPSEEWAMVSRPGLGTGLRVWHYVSYSLTPEDKNCRLIIQMRYRVERMPLAKLLEYLLRPFVVVALAMLSSAIRYHICRAAVRRD